MIDRRSTRRRAQEKEARHDASPAGCVAVLLRRWISSRCCDTTPGTVVSLRALTRSSLVAGLMACSVPAGDSTIEWTLANGDRVEEGLARAGPAAVLLLDPAECFECLSGLARFADARRILGPGRARLLWSRTPSQREQTGIALHRIRSDGVLARERHQRRLAVLLLFQDGQRVLTAPFRSHLADSVLQELVRAEQ